MPKTAEELAANYGQALGAMIETCEAIMQALPGLSKAQHEAFLALCEEHIERLTSRMTPLEGLFGG